MLAPLISEDAGVIVNSCTAGLAVYTATLSAISFGYTQRKPAKGYYILSVLFSSTAALSSGVATAARAFHINQLGFCSKAVGLGFYHAGNKAHLLAQAAEGKTVPYSPKLGRFRARSLINRNFSSNKVAFGSPIYIENIPYGKIIKISIFIFSVYQYSKLLRKSYCYAKRSAFKLQKQKNSKLLLKQSRYLVSRFSNSKNVRVS